MDLDLRLYVRQRMFGGVNFTDANDFSSACEFRPNAAQVPVRILGPSVDSIRGRRPSSLEWQFRPVHYENTRIPVHVQIV